MSRNKIDRTGETNISNEESKKYEAYCNINGKKTSLGYYNTIEQAFNAYKIAKENKIKRVANNCVSKGFITKDSRLYNSMISYQIEFND